jgi:predicted nucleic acid-binding protein
MIVLDTDVISELMRPRPAKKLVDRLSSAAAAEQATTTITLGELRFGAAKVRKPELYGRALSLISGLRVLAFDRAAAELYGDVRAQLERSGTPLADPDLRIAAISLAHAATLITRNLRHFERVHGLDAEDWTR